jgi:hypothetical protein
VKVEGEGGVDDANAGELVAVSAVEWPGVLSDGHDGKRRRGGC